MDSYDKILANIGKYVTLTSEEATAFTSILRKTRVKKRQFIVQPGFVCQHRNYVIEGAFRAYFLDKEGKEHTIRIAIEDWFISDFYSYITQTPATLYVEALEDALIFQMSYAEIEHLCREIHALSEYFRLTTERAFAHSRRRIQVNISQSAEDKYLTFLDKYPQIVNRVPQYVLASYLGMSPEFLSKIRARLARRS